MKPAQMIPSVMVNDHCQCHRSYNHLGSGPVGMLVGDNLDWANWGGKTHPLWPCLPWLRSWTVWVKKGSWAAACIHHPLLLSSHALWPASPSPLQSCLLPSLPAALSSHHDGLDPSRTASQIKPFLPCIVLIQVFYHNKSKVTKIWPSSISIWVIWITTIY